MAFQTREASPADRVVSFHLQGSKVEVESPDLVFQVVNVQDSLTSLEFQDHLGDVLCSHKECFQSVVEDCPVVEEDFRIKEDSQQTREVSLEIVEVFQIIEVVSQ